MSKPSALQPTNSSWTSTYCNFQKKVEQRIFQTQSTSTFPQCKGNSAIACRGELLDSTTVQDASTASVKCRQSTSKHIAQATKAKTQSCPASLLFNILKRFSSPKASNSTALEPSDAGKVPVLGQSLAAGHQRFSGARWRKIVDVRQGPNLVLGQASFVPLATALS